MIWETKKEKEKEKEKKSTFPRLHKEKSLVINSQLCHVYYTRCSRGKESQFAHAARALATAESPPSNPRRSSSPYAPRPSETKRPRSCNLSPLLLFPPLHIRHSTQ